MAPNFWMNQILNYLHVLQRLLFLWPTAPLQPFQLYWSSLDSSMFKTQRLNAKLRAFALSHKVSGTLLLSLPTKLPLVRARPAAATPGGTWWHCEYPDHGGAWSHRYNFWIRYKINGAFLNMILSLKLVSWRGKFSKGQIKNKRLQRQKLGLASKHTAARHQNNPV